MKRFMMGLMLCFGIEAGVLAQSAEGVDARTGEWFSLDDSGLHYSTSDGNAMTLIRSADTSSSTFAIHVTKAGVFEVRVDGHAVAAEDGLRQFGHSKLYHALLRSNRLLQLYQQTHGGGNGKSAQGKCVMEPIGGGGPCRVSTAVAFGGATALLVVTCGGPPPVDVMTCGPALATWVATDQQAREENCFASPDICFTCGDQDEYWWTYLQDAGLIGVPNRAVVGGDE